MNDNNAQEKGRYDIIIYAMMIVAVVYSVIQTILGNNNSLHFKLTLGIWIVASVAVIDIVVPRAEKIFDNKSDESLRYYLIYAVFDVLMFASLYIFIINVANVKEVFHYVFLGVAILGFLGRTFFMQKFEACNEHEDTVEYAADDAILPDESDEGATTATTEEPVNEETTDELTTETEATTDTSDATEPAAGVETATEEVVEENKTADSEELNSEESLLEPEESEIKEIIFRERKK